MTIQPPFRIRKKSESIVIEAGDGRPVAYLYYDNDSSRRRVSGRLTEDEAVAAAKVMARALADNFLGLK